MRPLLAALAATLALAAPAHAVERVIVAFGDSLTAGLGVIPEDSYPARLQAKLRAEGYAYRVVNAGSSGDTTAGGLRRVDWALKNKPQMVIVALGANDALRGQPVAGMRSNLEQMIRLARQARAQPVLVGLMIPPNYGIDYAAEFRDMYPAIAAKDHVPLVPFLLEGIADKPELFQADQLHPTAQAQARIAQNDVQIDAAFPGARRLRAGTRDRRACLC